jgi:hypothetical protein
MDPSHPHSEYPLRLSIRQIVGMVGTVTALIAACVLLALTNRKAVSVFGLVTLSPEQAAWMLWGCAGFLGLFWLPTTVATAWKGRFAGQRLGFAEAGLWLPKSVWSSQHELVPYTAILGARVLQQARQRLLEIELPGRTFWVGETWLPAPATFDEIVTRLEEGMAYAATKPTDPPAPADRPHT